MVKVTFYISCVALACIKKKSNFSHSFRNFAVHKLIGSFEPRVSITSQEHILAEKNIWEFLTLCGYVKHTLSPKCSINQFFTLRLVTLYSSCILSSDSCTYLKQKTSNVKASFFKHEVDKIYTKHKFSSSNYWLQCESISIDIKYPFWGEALIRGETRIRGQHLF